MHTLSNLVHEFKYELEDNHYESPALAKNLADYRSRVKAVLTYKPVFLEEEPIDEQLSIFALAKDDAKNVLAELKAINSKSNIFDIIDVLDKVGAFALKYLPFDREKKRVFRIGTLFLLIISYQPILPRRIFPKLRCCP